jgi:hypothetical protein
MKDSCGLCSTLKVAAEEVEVQVKGLPKVLAVTPKDNGIGEEQVESSPPSAKELTPIIEQPREDSTAEEESSKDVADSAKTKEAEGTKAVKNEEKTGQPKVEEEKEQETRDSPDEAKVAETKDKTKKPGQLVVNTSMASIPIVLETTSKECDFDKNPTDLYLSLMRKDWKAAVERIVQKPSEAAVWIYRKETNGKLRWKLLPIHAAVIFHAPENVVDALLTAYPHGAVCKDDQGMVPLHLSIRMGSSDAIVKQLLQAGPESLQVRDYKGRTPKILAELSTADNKESVRRTLGLTAAGSPTASPARSPVSASPKESATTNPKSVSSPTATAAAAAAAAAQAASEVFSAAAQAVTSALSSEELEKVKRESTAERIELSAKIEVLEAELAESREMSAMLCSESKAYKEKIVALKAALEEQSKKSADNERENKDRILELETENGKLRKSREDFKERLEKAMQSEQALAEKFERVSLSKDEKESELATSLALNQKQTDKILVLEAEAVKLQNDMVNIQNDVGIMQDKLEEITHSEQALAWQNSSLTEKLRDAARGEGSERVRALEKERDDLRLTVNKLSIKLYKVVGFLDEMVQEQEMIIEETLTREGSTDAADSEVKDRQDAEQVDRQKLLQNVTGMKAHIIGVIDSVIDGMPRTVADDDVLAVDEVINTVVSHHKEEQAKNKVEAPPDDVEKQHGTVNSAAPGVSVKKEEETK